jgi:hypothetical protein
MSQTWLFVSKNGMRIEEDTPDIQLRAQGDQYIMQAFYNAEYRREELWRLNLCRLFLRVAAVADLSTADGSQILETAWVGKERLNSRSAILWPNQGKLDKGTWNQWQNALTKSLSLSRSRRLEAPLGDWIDNDDSWEWFFDLRCERLYRREGPAAWSYYRRSSLSRGTRGALMKFTDRQATDEKPASLVRATVYQQRAFWVLQAKDNRSHSSPHQTEPTISTTLREATDRLPEEASSAIQDWRCTDDDQGATVAQAI